MKQCSRCKEVKELSQFYKDSGRKDGHAYICKQCASLVNKAWRANNPEHARRVVREADKRYRDSDTNYQARKTAKKYGLTLEQYLDIVSKPCYICEVRQGNCIDHCHATGIVRGGLCSNCNAALGHFRDNIEWLERAIKYLRAVG